MMEAGALVGALGAVLLLLSRSRVTLLAGFVLVGAGAAGLVIAFRPDTGLSSLPTSAAAIAGALLALALLGAFCLGTVALRRGEHINALWIVVAAVSLYLVAYRFYSLFIADKVMQLDPTRATPAVINNDGLDYVPTNKHVLFGHHFAAIAGAGPLVGPVLAAQMGYLPGLLWLVVGVVLAGAVQDFMVLFLSSRRNGRSLGDLVREEMGQVPGTIALFGAFLIMIIILAVLAMVVLGGIGHIPGVVLGGVLLAALPEVLRHVVEPAQQALFGTVLIEAEVLRQLLYGLALLYGAAGGTNYADIAAAAGEMSDDVLFLAGIALVLAGLAFKASIAPFHLSTRWPPSGPASVTRPITAKSSSHLRKIASASASRPGLSTISIRSCDSDSIIS